MGEFIQLPTTLLVGAAGLIVLAAIVILLLRLRASTKNITVQAILDAMLPYIYKGILAAEKIAQQGFSQANVLLEGADKKAVADSVYSLLPDVLLLGSIPIPISLAKRFVTREMFAQFVEEIYQESSGFIERNKAYLRKQVDALVPDEFEPGKLTWVPVADKSGAHG